MTHTRHIVMLRHAFELLVELCDPVLVAFAGGLGSLFKKLRNANMRPDPGHVIPVSVCYMRSFEQPPPPRLE